MLYEVITLWYEKGIVELDHAKEYGRLRLQDQDELVFNLATDKPRLVNHYCGVFTDITDKFQRGEDNKDLTEA